MRNLFCCFAFITLISCSVDLSDKSGLYKSSFPNLSIELQKGGNVFVTPKHGSGNTFYCRTTGSWSEISENEVNIILEANVNCDWLSDLNGNWIITEVNTFEGNKTLLLSKGTWKLIR